MTTDRRGPGPWEYYENREHYDRSHTHPQEPRQPVYIVQDNRYSAADQLAGAVIGTANDIVRAANALIIMSAITFIGAVVGIGGYELIVPESMQVGQWRDNLGWTGGVIGFLLSIYGIWGRKGLEKFLTTTAYLIGGLYFLGLLTEIFSS